MNIRPRASKYRHPEEERVFRASSAVGLVAACALGAVAMHAFDARTSPTPPTQAAPRRIRSPDCLARGVPGDADDGAPFRLTAKAGGWSVSELCAALTQATGRPILLDRVDAAVRANRVECTADIEMSGPRLFDWVQAALFQKDLALVPVGPRCANWERTWQVRSICDPVMISSAVEVEDDHVLDYADRNGLYVVTTLRVPEGVDTTQMRNALSLLATQTAGLGRISDVPKSHSLVVIDFGPVVAAMKRQIDAVGAATPPPPRPEARPSIH